MRRALFVGVSIGMLALGPASAQKPASGWTTLFDGTNLDNFNTVGNANWKLGGGMVEATSGPFTSGPIALQ